MNKLILVRHGQSEWNLENRFTGWTDVDLSEAGIQEAVHAGLILKENGFVFDIAYTSYLKRAIRTLWIILYQLDLAWIPVEKSWMLNERHYGALQGLNKSETAAQFGEEQVKIWRRSADVRPPLLDKNDSRNAVFDTKYRHVPEDDIPLAESLVDTEQRVIKYWKKAIQPSLQSNKRVIIVAHGNTIRAIIKYLESIPANEIINIDVPTAVPLVYEFNDNMTAIRRYYLSE